MHDAMRHVVSHLYFLDDLDNVFIGEKVIEANLLGVVLDRRSPHPGTG